MNEEEKVQTKQREAWVIKWGMIFIVALMVALVLTGCNTMAGLGKDISSAAKGIQDRMSEPDDQYDLSRR
jgi:predicted small secreted protein